MADQKKVRKPSRLPDLTEEIRLGFFNLLSPDKIIIGVDEVGRGCLAGPVVAAAAVLDFEKIKSLPFNQNGERVDTTDLFDQYSMYSNILKIRDSKMVPEPERGPMAEAVKKFVLGYSLGLASVEEIETINILYASHLAMERAVYSLEDQLGKKAEMILVDGHIVPRVFFARGAPLIKGDQKSLTIACASIIAKVYRDDLMAAFDTQYPGYGFKEHKGYGTPYHKKQIGERGVTALHRKTFGGVKEYCVGETL